MPRMRLTQAGYQTLTGPLLGVKFTSGVSPDIPLATIDRIAAAIAGNIVAANGTTVISPAGKLQRELAQEGRVREATPPADSRPDNVVPATLTSADLAEIEGAAERAEDAADRAEAAADRAEAAAPAN